MINFSNLEPKRPDNQYSPVTVPVRYSTYLGIAAVAACGHMHSTAGVLFSCSIPALTYAWSLWIGSKINTRKPDDPGRNGSTQGKRGSRKKACNTNDVIEVKNEEGNNSKSVLKQHHFGIEHIVLNKRNVLDDLLSNSIETNFKDDFDLEDSNFRQDYNFEDLRENLNSKVNGSFEDKRGNVVELEERAYRNELFASDSLKNRLNAFSLN